MSEAMLALPGCRLRMAARASLGRLIRRMPDYTSPDRLRVTVATTRRPAGVSPRILAWVIDRPSTGNSGT
jgi:hypothetical protein